MAQQCPRIERYERRGETWILTEVEGLESSVAIESIGCTLALFEVYDKVPLGKGEK